MTLSLVPIPPEEDPISPQVSAFFTRAGAHIESFLSARLEHPLPAFVSSDFEAAYRALRAIARHHLAPGPRLCEWGCGLGAVATLASWLGFEAFGIEIEPDLVAAARALAEASRAKVTFVEGSFIPPGGESLTDDDLDVAWLAQRGPVGYEALDLDLDDFDVIYAFPWPGGEVVLEHLFDRFAAAGSLLVTYRGLEGIVAQRKDIEEGGPRRLDATSQIGW